MNDIPKSLSSVRVTGFVEQNFMLIAEHNKSYAVITCNITNGKIRMTQMEPLSVMFPELFNDMPGKNLLTGFVDNNQLSLVSGTDGVSFNWNENETTIFQVPSETTTLISAGGGYFHVLQNVDGTTVSLVSQQLPFFNDTNNEDSENPSEPYSTPRYLCYENNVIKVSRNTCAFQANLLSAGFIWNNKFYVISTDDQLLVFDNNITWDSVLNVQVIHSFELFEFKQSIGIKGIILMKVVIF